MLTDPAGKQTLVAGIQSIEAVEKEVEPSEKTIPFYKVSRSLNMNIFDVLTSLPKAEGRFITEIAKGFSYNEFVIEYSFPAKDKSNLNKAFKGLERRKLVRRVKSNHYMINPHLLIPSYARKQVEAGALWKQINPDASNALLNMSKPLEIVMGSAG